MAKKTQMLNDHVDNKTIDAINAKERKDITDKYADLELQAQIDKAVQEQNARAKIAENEEKERKDKEAWNKTQAENKEKEDKDKAEKEKLRIKTDSDELTAILDAAIQEQIDDDKQATEDHKALYMQRVQLVHDSLQAISDITSLFANKNEKDQKRVFEIQKAVSMAQTIISTIESAQAAFKNALTSPISKLMPDGGISLAVAAAGIATAAGVAKLKQIKDTKFQSSSAPTNPDSNGGGRKEPSINPTINQQRQIVGNTTGAMGNQTQTNDIKVYVTETDISSRQGRVDEIRRRALVK